ncbi:TetR/AcrR family transcriptional regulator [Paractinoplanes lichenicola]|uniref:TetR/AcrR family transcriptional regulator C-terminal domain-containing protein n=1 Tax=Paractinoplanes lichenicola TaxID=2802976 RepID=A0ABS1VF04_9ACTN|nr:TetR family transcriptional regulator [Actinoplanes lichenicola]MBL7253283.1 TetR/AcrR family transcriptional regulator C-terminal domain-containing protein [Actinoplanes lichenicola]
MPRRATLTTDAITAAALRVGDREGPAAMSMRRIANELGCDPMALYRHFPDREALLDAVADRALTGLPLPAPELPWDERLTELFLAIRAAALQHPGIAGHLAARPPLGPSARPLFGAMASALTEAGLSPEDGVRTVQALVAYLSAALAMAARAGAPDERWEQVKAAISALPGAPPGDALPVTGSEEQFRYGLGLLVAGIRAAGHGDGGGG